MPGAPVLDSDTGEAAPATQLAVLPNAVAPDGDVDEQVRRPRTVFSHPLCASVALAHAALLSDRHVSPAHYKQLLCAVHVTYSRHPIGLK